ncbi:MAG: flagellar hook-basal body complex protein FliE [Tissierellaceae bacterium]|nr:flagellar hook-basal body complex protein FliE [Tissierellaceae bacterium]
MNINQINSVLKLNSNIVQDKTASVQESFNFKNIVNDAMNDLNDKQLKADELTYDFITGNVDDLHTVLIATEEARLSLELAVQVRNKCIEAYKEINNMQL